MKHIVTALVFSLVAFPALAQVLAKDPWVRATVPQQTATGAYVRLESAQDARLVSASSPAAGVVEIHEMKMENGVMKMRAVPSVAIPAGKGVELKPGGYHMMLMNLKAQVQEGDAVPITLVIEAKDGKRRTLEVKAAVKPLATSSHGGMKH